MLESHQYITDGLRAGCPRDQMEYFIRAGLVLQPRQLAASAAARRALQRDPGYPADVLKTNPNEEGLGGDDAADALRYLVATPVPNVHVAKLRGL